jgi:hypothetical protein
MMDQNQSGQPTTQTQPPNQNPQSQPEQTPRPTFDAAICELLRSAALDILSRYPEARSIAAVVDFHGALNDAEVNKGIWLGENGPVKNPAEIFGSIFQTLRLLESQVGRAVELVQQLKDHAELLGSEVVKRSEELKQIEEAIRSRRTGSAAAEGRADSQEEEKAAGPSTV